MEYSKYLKKISYIIFNGMFSEIMNITVKNDHAGSATLCMKSKLNASDLTMRYPKVSTAHVLIFSSIFLPYLLLFSNFGA